MAELMFTGLSASERAWLDEKKDPNEVSIFPGNVDESWASDVHKAERHPHLHPLTGLHRFDAPLRPAHR